MEHRLKITKSVRPNNAKLSEIVQKMEAKGIEVNKETLKTRSKSRKTIAELEKAADERAKKVLDDSDSDGELVDNASMADEEQNERGRKRRRDKSIDSNEYMDDDEQRVKPKSSGKRSMTPA